MTSFLGGVLDNDARDSSIDAAPREAPARPRKTDGPGFESTGDEMAPHPTSKRWFEEPYALMEDTFLKASTHTGNKDVRNGSIVNSSNNFHCLSQISALVHASSGCDGWSLAFWVDGVLQSLPGKEKHPGRREVVGMRGKYIGCMVFDIV